MDGGECHQRHRPLNKLQLKPAEPLLVVSANQLPCGYSTQLLSQVGALLNEINKTWYKPGWGPVFFTAHHAGRMTKLRAAARDEEGLRRGKGREKCSNYTLKKYDKIGVSHHKFVPQKQTNK